MSTTTTYTGVRIVDMPDLGAVTDDSSVVGEHAGSGRFGALALRDYMNIQGAVAAAVAPSFGNVGRNLIHNPLMAVAQRGTGPFTTLGSYTLDRWFLSGVTDTVSVTQQGLGDAYRASIGDESAVFALANAFTGSAAAGAYNIIIQGIEGVRRLSGKTVTLSFWAICGSGALKLGANFQQVFGTGGSPSAAVVVTGQSVTLSTTFTRYNLTFAIPSTAGKTFGTNNNDATYLNFAFSSGAANNAAYGNVGVQSGLIWLWGVQLEVGSTATPLDYGGSPQQQLMQCQRFYYAFSGNIPIAVYTLAGTSVFTEIVFPMWMRAAPTISNQTYAGVQNTSVSGWQYTDQHRSNFYLTSVAATLTTATITGFTASADL